jgi:cytochrome c553
MRFSAVKVHGSWALVGAALLGASGCQSVEGDALRGGQLYDNWWVVTEQSEPAGDHPLWASRPDAQSNSRTGAQTWRCKECHGWDYAGVDGTYGSGDHRTGIKGVLATNKSAAQLIDLLEDAHGYGGVLDEQSIADLVAFIQQGAIDTTTIIASDGSFYGDAQLGDDLYLSACVQCHGKDGLQPPPGAADDFGDYPGFLANDNPQEFLHKVRFGQPGSVMPPQADNLSDFELSNLGAFVQILPQGPDQD